MSSITYTAEEQAELRMLQSLVNGIAPDGRGDNGRGLVGMSTRMEAGKRLREILEARKEREDRAREKAQDFGLREDQQGHQQVMDRDRLTLESVGVQAKLQLEQRRLDLEAERIEVEKAKVIVLAIEAAARHPQLAALTDVVNEMSFRLLGGEMLPALEDKSTQEGKDG